MTRHSIIAFRRDLLKVLTDISFDLDELASVLKNYLEREAGESE